MITTERVNIALPIGLRNEVKQRGYNLSAVCTDALKRRVIDHDQREEFEEWCKTGMVAAQKDV